MTLHVARRTVAKAGNDESENEDRALWVSDGDRLRVAVADGATEASFSDLWADALVSSWIRGQAREIDDGFLQEARARWLASLPDIGSLPWYAQAKLEEGSHATFACLTISASPLRRRWSAQVIGDCQLFVLKRRKGLVPLRAAPAAKSSDFGYHPSLVPSEPGTWAQLSPIKLNGRIRPPFEMWLTTDAFAEACLAAAERGKPEWDDWAEALAEPDEFRAKVDDARLRGRMRNDDTTVCRIWSP
jgi:hypothetical protein